MSPGALADMMGVGTFSAEAAARKALEAATGEAAPEAEGWLWRSTGAVRVWAARAMATMRGFLGFRD